MCLDHIWVLSTSVDGHLGRFHLLVIVSECCCEHWFTGFCEDVCFHSLVDISRSGIAGPYENSVYLFAELPCGFLKKRIYPSAKPHLARATQVELPWCGELLSSSAVSRLEQPSDDETGFRARRHVPQASLPQRVDSSEPHSILGLPLSLKQMRWAAPQRGLSFEKVL